MMNKAQAQKLTTKKEFALFQSSRGQGFRKPPESQELKVFLKEARQFKRKYQEKSHVPKKQKLKMASRLRLYKHKIHLFQEMIDRLKFQIQESSNGHSRLMRHSTLEDIHAPRSLKAHKAPSTDKPAFQPTDQQSAKNRQVEMTQATAKRIHNFQRGRNRRYQKRHDLRGHRS